MEAAALVWPLGLSATAKDGIWCCVICRTSPAPLGLSATAKDGICRTSPRRPECPAPAHRCLGYRVWVMGSNPNPSCTPPLRPPSPQVGHPDFLFISRALAGDHACMRSPWQTSHEVRQMLHPSQTPKALCREIRLLVGRQHGLVHLLHELLNVCEVRRQVFAEEAVIVPGLQLEQRPARKAHHAARGSASVRRQVFAESAVIVPQLRLQQQLERLCG
eukprot:351674-Chlamydomonas_euryale.AAC.3